MEIYGGRSIMSLDTYTNPFNMLFPGTEAIDFQMSSKLGQKLTDLFQTVIDYRENLDYSTVPDNVQDQRTFRLKQVEYFFKTKCVEKFKKIVEDETGITLNNLYCWGGDTDISGMFAVDLSFGNEAAANDILGNMSGTGDSAYSAKEAIEDMMAMADNMDLSKGRVTSKTYGRNKKRKYAITAMYFDINCAFNAHDFVPTRAMEPLTAREIASIMMHEIGHVMSTVEHAGDYFATADRLRSYSRNLRSDTEVKDFLNQFTDRFIPYLNKVRKTLKLSGPEAKVADNCFGIMCNASQAMRKFVSEEQTSENVFWTAGSVIVNAMIGWGKVLLALFIDTAIMVTGVLLLTYEIGRVSQYSDKNSMGNKAGDLKTTMNNQFLVERWADEFVSRHGFGDDLASALNKLEKIFEFTAMYEGISSARMRNWSVMYYLMNFNIWLMQKIFIASYFDPIIYENQYQRIVRIKQNTLAVFKNPKLDGRVRDHYLGVVERLEKEAKEAKTLSDTAFSKALYNILRNFTSPVRWFQLIKNNNLDRDLSIMFDRIDDLKNNKLYYISSKIAAIKDDR